MKRDMLNIIRDNLHNPNFFEEAGIDRKVEGNLIFLNYDITSKPNQLNKWCRGTIFRTNGTLLMLPFTRFFNEHEIYVDNVDWRSARIIEKIDGTMMSVWHDDREKRLRLSTKRMVDELLVEQFGGGKKVDLAKVFKEFFPDYQNVLDEKYWYVFEAVSEHNRIVTKYTEGRYGRYLVCVRQRRTLDELSPERIQDIVKKIGQPKVFTPEYYDLKDRKRIDVLFESKRSDWEGVVITDDNHKRMKIKQLSYVKLHHIMSNISSKRNMLDLIMNGEQNEVLAYFPDLKGAFLDLEKEMNKLKSDIATVFGMYNHLESQKEFALKVKELPYSGFLFRLRRGEDLKYQFMQMGGKKLEKYL